MILHNTTFSVDQTVNEAWLDWIKEIYFAAAKESGWVNQFRLMRMRNVPDDSGLTYSVQLYFIQESHWEEFLDAIEPSLLNHLVVHFGEKVLFFQSQLDVIE
jgi:hypothetical protein